jgi:hypothetical protein
MNAVSPVSLPFRVDLAAFDEGGPALGERKALTITARNPAVSRHSEEELAESGLVRADFAAWLEVPDRGVSFARAFGERDR